MPYTTLDKIIGQISADRVLQLSDDSDGAIVTVAMLLAAASGGALTGYTAGEQASIAVALDNVTETITSADAIINGYCAARYIVPFNPVPDIIAKCSLDMAIYNLYSRRVETMPEVRDKNNSAATKLLAAIANGTITLGSTAVVAPPNNGNAPAMIRTNDRIFTSTKMDTY